MPNLVVTLGILAKHENGAGRVRDIDKVVQAVLVPDPRSGIFHHKGKGVPMYGIAPRVHGFAERQGIGQIE